MKTKEVGHKIHKIAEKRGGYEFQLINDDDNSMCHIDGVCSFW